MFELILFDLDGTLTDPKEGITNCVKFALEHFGITETDETLLLRFIGPPLYDSFREIYGFTHTEANKAVEKYRERFSEIGIFENRVMEYAAETLKGLKNSGKRIALATSKPLVFAERILQKFELAEYFDYVVGAELDGTRNYKNEVIEEVLRRSECHDRSKAVMVGDREQDIVGAKQCGIASVGVKCGYAEENELENAGADYIFRNLKEVCDFLINIA